MPDLGDIQRFMTEGVPFNRLLGIRVASIAPEQAEVALAVTPDHLNHVGTVHASAQFGLAEAASGAMVIAAFGDLLAQGLVPLARQAEINYRKPATGDLLAVATLTAAERQRVNAEVAERGRARFTVPVQILDDQSTVVSEITVQWVLLRQS
jgi:uncharacterized protein (TIGR00369 family)